MIDVIIVGAGPAGISAALYLKRLKKEVVIFTTNSSTLKKAHIIDNYYGLPNISGEDLYKSGVKQATDLGIKIIESEVLEINKALDFEVVTTTGKFNAKAVIIATGASRSTTNIKNLSLYEGSGVSYCATCDGFFFKNKKVAVIGSGEFALLEATHLLNVTDDVTIYTNGSEVSESILSSKFKVVTDKISEVKKTDTLIIVGDTEYSVDGIFVAIGVAGSNSFAKKLGLAMNGNYLEVDNTYQTYVPGLYAVGDCIGGFLQISKAISDGAQVSAPISKYLRGL